MGNVSNEWAKRRRKTLLKERPKAGKCEHRGCTKTGAVIAHVIETPLCRTGPRRRKERLSEYKRYPKHFNFSAENTQKPTSKQNTTILFSERGKRKQ